MSEFNSSVSPSVKANPSPRKTITERFAGKPEQTSPQATTPMTTESFSASLHSEREHNGHGGGSRKKECWGQLLVAETAGRIQSLGTNDRTAPRRHETFGMLEARSCLALGPHRFVRTPVCSSVQSQSDRTVFLLPALLLLSHCCLLPL